MSASSCASEWGCGIRWRRRCNWCKGHPTRRRRIGPAQRYYRQLWRVLSRLLTLREWHAIRVVSIRRNHHRQTEVPRQSSEAMDRSSPGLLFSGTGCIKMGHISLSQALLALWRLKLGCPGWSWAVGLLLAVVSVSLPGRVCGTRGHSRCAVAGLWSERRRCWRLRWLRHEGMLARRHVVVSASRW